MTVVEQREQELQTSRKEEHIPRLIKQEIAETLPLSFSLPTTFNVVL